MNSGISTVLMNSSRMIMSRVFFRWDFKKWAKNIHMLTGNVIADSAMQVNVLIQKLRFKKYWDLYLEL